MKLLYVKCNCLILLPLGTTLIYKIQLHMYMCVRAHCTTVLASTAVFVIRVRVKMQHIFIKKMVVQFGSKSEG